MNKQIFVNIPVSDVAKSTTFYEALGFVKNNQFSNDDASSMVWSEHIYVMLVGKEFYKKFLRTKDIADTSTTSAALIAFTLESKEAVQKFADAAKANGGDYFKVEMGIPEEMMFGYEVLDLDGNQLEPVWMNTEFDPESQQ